MFKQVAAAALVLAFAVPAFAQGPETPGLDKREARMFDVATKLGFEREDEDFGQTLAVWGAPNGAYVVLPLYGPSNVRDTVGTAGDMLLGAFVVVFYTLIGGFLAVCWTDFIQGVMMFFAILIVPMAAIYSIGGVSTTFTALYTIDPQYFNPFTKADGSMLSFVELISLLGWGLGYFGQPHILVRFMAITSSAEIKQATRIAMTWVVLSLAAAVLVGMVGRVYLTTALTGSDSETVFLVMTNLLFNPFAAGLVLSAVLAAIMIFTPF